MTPAWRSALRGAVIAAGVAVTLASVLAMRRADWPIYVVFSVLSIALFKPYVEVVRGVPLPIPLLATTLGFLYIGGLPIVALTTVPSLLTLLLRSVLPRDWRQRVPWVQTGGAESATYVLGLGVRWWIVSVLVPGQPATAHPWAMFAAEICGYAVWLTFAIAPIYPDRPFFVISSEGGFRTAMNDIWLAIVLAQIPFVFLISYGYRAEGLAGAAAWSLSTVGIHFMLKRLTERRLKVEEQNQRLEALNRELEHRERLSAIGKMSSVVSHQILHQLGVIGVYADLIRNADDGGDAPAGLLQARTNAAAIEGALRDVNRVLTDLLVFSKDLRLNLYEHPLQGLIGECLEACHSTAMARGVTLRADCPADISLLLDKLKIKQAIINVVRNGIEASPRAGEVVVRVAVAGDEVCVAVSDEGAGIPAADHEAIFAPFFTTKEQGTGLGLAIARQFAEAHGGRLIVDQGASLSGARVVFRLPLHRAEPRAVPG